MPTTQQWLIGAGNSHQIQLLYVANTNDVPLVNERLHNSGALWHNLVKGFKSFVVVAVPEQPVAPCSIAIQY